MYIIYSKPNCPFCDQAKALLNSKDLPYIELVLGKGYTIEQLLAKVPSVKTVPQIFLDTGSSELHIGSFGALKEHLNYSVK